jgi:hypothetical protein
MITNYLRIEIHWLKFGVVLGLCFGGGPDTYDQLKKRSNLRASTKNQGLIFRALYQPDPKVPQAHNYFPLG